MCIRLLIHIRLLLLLWLLLLCESIRSISRQVRDSDKYKTVNHSKNFVDPEGRKHTQLIECLWSVARATIMRRGRGTCKGNLPGYLGEQWFRSIHQKIHQSFLLKFWKWWATFLMKNSNRQIHFFSYLTLTLVQPSSFYYTPTTTGVFFWPHDFVVDLFLIIYVN